MSFPHSQNSDLSVRDAQGRNWIPGANGAWVPAPGNNLAPPYASQTLPSFAPSGPPSHTQDDSMRLPPIASLNVGVGAQQPFSFLPPPPLQPQQIVPGPGGGNAAPGPSTQDKMPKNAKATDDEDTPVGSKRKRASQKGRSSGAANYTEDDYNILFPLLRHHKPIGQRKWATVTEEYNEQAEEIGRPTRLQKSLETKFKQLVKTTKPTGDAELPPHIEAALEIEEMINEKAGTRDLDDDDLDEGNELMYDSDSEKENEPPVNLKKAKPTVPVATDALLLVVLLPIAAATLLTL
ncbi:hypothetical protein BDP27DRAFT_1419450 [Rhodocollybia butyracea]|uniref:DUF6818 domain-containing protein n=1 Tax=Rhodocollybia butyracea TaxID=206335 RepID=A0A9P5PRK5_9AGAR|nr:hypothetical protein BDP27DRAFT_1419450 [Rhodocollybia butyracea]